MAGRAIAFVLAVILTVAECEVILNASGTDETFIMNVGAKPASHPFFGIGFGAAYSINGNLSGVHLYLSAGHSYTFINNAACGANHPLYLTNSSVGAGASAITLGITSSNYNSVCSGANFTFTPQESQINTTIYYQCRVHSNMGWKITVLPSDVSIQGGKWIPNPTFVVNGGCLTFGDPVEELDVYCTQIPGKDNTIVIHSDYGQVVKYCFTATNTIYQCEAFFWGRKRVESDGPSKGKGDLELLSGKSSYNRGFPGVIIVGDPTPSSKSSSKSGSQLLAHKSFVNAIEENDTVTTPQKSYTTVIGGAIAMVALVAMIIAAVTMKRKQPEMQPLLG